MRIFRQYKKRPAFCISVKFFCILIFGFSLGFFSPAAFGESSNLSGGVSSAASVNSSIAKLASSCVSVFSSADNFSNDEKQAIILRAYEDLLKLAVTSIPPELASALLRNLVQSPLDIRTRNVDENSTARSSVPDLSFHPAIHATGLGPSLAQMQLILAELNMSEVVLPLLKEIAQNKLDSLNKITQEVRKQKEVKRNAKHSSILKGFPGSVDSVAFSPDGKTLASGSEDNTVRLWKLDDNTSEWFLHSTLTIILTTHRSSVSSVAFSPDGKTLAVGLAYDNTIRIWKLDENTGSWNPHSFLPGHDSPARSERHDSSVKSVAFSPDGKTLASMSSGSHILIWKLDEAIDQWRHHDISIKDIHSLFSVVFDSDGSLLAIGSWDSYIRISKLDDITHAWSTNESIKGHDSRTTSVTLSPSGKMLASGCTDNTIQIWEIDEKTGAWLPHSKLAGHSSTVISLAFSQDGKTLSSGSKDATIRIWNLEAIGL